MASAQTVPTADNPIPESAGPRKEGRPLRSAAVYAVAAASQRLALFVLLPFVTRVMSPASYGDLSILLTLSGGCAVLLTFGMELPIFRKLIELQSDPVRKAHFVGSVWRFMIAVPIVLAALSGGAIWVLGGIGRIGGVDIFLALLGAAFFVAATTVPLALLRAEQRLREYLIIAGANTIVTPCLVLILVVLADQEATGWLLAVLIGNIATLAVAMAVVPWTSEGEPGVAFKGVLPEGIPLMPHFLAQWSLNLADRLVLATLVSASLLGVYSLAANLAIPLLVFVQAINQGFMPSYARAGVDPDQKVELRKIVCLQIAIVTAGAVTAITLAAPTVSLVAPSSYQEATSLLGWLVLGFFFLGLYYIPMNGATLGAKRGKLAWIVTVFSAAVNLGLIVALVPTAGIEAAAIASAVGYFVLLVGIAVYARGRGNPVEYDWIRIVSLLSVAGVFVAAALLVTPASGVGAFAIRLGGSLAVAIALIGISIAGSGRTGSMPIVRLSG